LKIKIREENPQETDNYIKNKETCFKKKMVRDAKSNGKQKNSYGMKIVSVVLGKNRGRKIIFFIFIGKIWTIFKKIFK